MIACKKSDYQFEDISGNWNIATDSVRPYSTQNYYYRGTWMGPVIYNGLATDSFNIRTDGNFRRKEGGMHYWGTYHVLATHEVKFEVYDDQNTISSYTKTYSITNLTEHSLTLTEYDIWSTTHDVYEIFTLKK